MQSLEIEIIKIQQVVLMEQGVDLLQLIKSYVKALYFFFSKFHFHFQYHESVLL
jgi:hypothetical protein